MKKILPGLFFIFTSRLRWGFCFFILVCSAQFSFAQNPLVKQWDYRFGGTSYDWLRCFQQTTDGGYILGGTSISGIGGDKTQDRWGGNDFWIVKLDSLGNKLWDKDFGGTDDDDLSSLQQTTDGGYILGGSSNSGIGGDKTQATWGFDDYWIIKTDSLGNKQWDKDFGGTSFEYLYSLQQTADGGYILGGITLSDISGDKTQVAWGSVDYWIVKTDAVGNKQWDKDFGGTYDESFSSVQQTVDGGYILGGSSPSGIGGDKTQAGWGGYSDYWILKTDSLGTKQWDKDFGGTGYDELSSVQQTVDGGYILSGTSNSGIGGDKTKPTWGSWDDHDYWIIKTNSLGVKLWDQDFGGTSDDLLYSFEQTAGGGCILAGISSSPISGNKTENSNFGLIQTWVVRTDSLGAVQWDKTIFTNTFNYTGFAIQTRGGCYAIANFTDAGIGGYVTQTGQGAFDYWIIKFCDTTGALPFLANPDKLCEKFCTNFYDQSTNNPTMWQWSFPGGDPSSSTDQNPATICYQSPGVYDVTLITTNANGNDTLTLHNYITVSPTPPIPTITHAGDILTSGTASSYQWQFNAIDIPGATNQSYIALQSGLYTVIVGDSNSCKNSFTEYVLISGVSDVKSDGNISIVPNPSNGNFTIEFTGLTDNVSIEVINAVGQIIFSSADSRTIVASPFKKEIDLQSVATGVYTVEIKTKDASVRKKIV